MSGIIGSKLNIRGSGRIAKLGTDGQVLTSSGAGVAAAFEAATTTYDDNKIQSNIALLGFKCAVNGSLAKYNLQDQIIDEYEDATGIDAGNSTNELLSSGVYSGGTAISAPTGATSTDTSVSGYTTHVLSAASGSLVVGGSLTVDILVVGGGGSAGNAYGGGGGAGGLIYKPSHALTAQTYAWVTGAGGASPGTAGVGNYSIGNVGADSTWTDASASVEFTAKGGGAGAQQNDAAGDGGSGGGSGHSTTNRGDEIQSAQSGDSATYGFGFDGGQGTHSPDFNPGGGGGAGSIGQSGTTAKSGDGGTGKDYSAIFGTAVGDSGWFASGGAGAASGDGNTVPGTASAGGGSDGLLSGTSDDGQANTGGGSGGASTPGAGGSGIILVRHANASSGSDLTLQSTDTTAMTEPDYADMIILMENAEGTATLNTDIKGYISEDSGVTFTQGTLVDEGTWGTNKKILAFHDLDISAQSGTSMCYKITTHNQSSGSKETKIHATSIGWKA